MNRLRNLLKLLFTLLIALFFQTQEAKAEHIIGGDIYWECVTAGPDVGKFIFYLKLYRDCSVENTTISAAGNTLIIDNHPDFIGTLIDLNLISEQDITNICGVGCGAAVAGDISVREYVFATDPIVINGVPPANGYQISYHRCCRNQVDNIVDANNQEIRYTATMYPLNGQNVNPCYDSSPQFAEKPTSVLCSGYELRYNSDAVDSDLDSLSYELVEALGTTGPVTYAAGYSPTTPLPGPTLDPAYDQVTLDPVTGQLEYDGPAGLQGRWTVVAAVYGWRCGQQISKTIREMSVTMLPCLEPNNIPSVTAPVWASPGTASGYEVTVQAGDLVNFTLTGTDNDVTGGNAQVLEFNASGSQFGTNFTNANAGCQNPPCATLSNVSPPTSGVGSLSTTFNWQTTCDHVAVQDACANLSNTYNFLFKFQDDFCPARGTNIVNVAVTVLGEPIVDSPDPHCVSVAANGDVTLTWDPVTDSSIPPSFFEYSIFHSTSPNGPFGTAQEIGTVSNINTGTFVHAAGNPVAAPSTTGPNYYVIRTRSGCNDAVLDAPIDTVASIFLSVFDNTTTADLSWNAVATPNLSSANAMYDVWRLEPGGVWTLIASTPDLFYSDPVIWCLDELITYRIELGDALPCTSVSNEAAENLSNPTQPIPQPIDSVSVDPVTGLVTICWPVSESLNVIEYNIYQNPDQQAWDLVATVVGYNTTCWTDPNADPQSESLWYQVTATNNCGQEGVAAGSGADGTNRSQTMWLQHEVDGCTKEAYLDWTPYWHWPEGVKEYEIYASLDAQPYTKIATVPDSVISYTQTDLQAGSEYCHYVRAVKNSLTRITASSNSPCSDVYIPKRPDYDYNYNTTVIPGNTGIEEYFFCDSTAGYLGFDVKRGTNLSSLSTVWFVPFDLNTRYYQYTDPGARPAFNSYYYAIIGIDSCDLPADTMNISRTMFLEAEANSDRTNFIQWNPYEGWLGNVSAYNIYRSVDGVYDFLETVPPSQLTYLDNVQEIIVGEGNFCYYIEAVEVPGVLVGPAVAPPEPEPFQSMSLSNEACARQHPNVFMPNAFMPEGINNVFKPVTVYVEAESYLFRIYNRWGQQVFESTDPNKGWNGTHGGKEDPQGGYVYYVQFVSSDGQTYSKSGSVTLIR